MLMSRARLSLPVLIAAGRSPHGVVFTRNIAHVSQRFESRVVPAEIRSSALARSFSSNSGNGDGSNQSKGGFNWRSHRVAALWAATGLGGAALCEGEAAEAEAQKENTDLMNQAMDALGPIASQMTIGSVMGYATGKALLTAGNMMAIFVGTSFMIFQGLAYKGYIAVNWTPIVSDTKLMFDMDGDGDFDTDDMKLIGKKFIEVCTFNLPGGGGFTAGLLFGLGFGGKTAGTAAAAIGTASIVPRALMIGAGATTGPAGFSGVGGGDPVEAFKSSVQGLGLQSLREVEAKMKVEMKASSDAEQKEKLVKMLNVVEEAKKAAKSAAKK